MNSNEDCQIIYEDDTVLPPRHAIFVTLNDHCNAHLIYNALRSEGAEFIFIHQEQLDSKGMGSEGVNTPLYQISSSQSPFLAALHKQDIQTKGKNINLMISISPVSRLRIKNPHYFSLPQKVIRFNSTISTPPPKEKCTPN